MEQLIQILNVIWPTCAFEHNQDKCLIQRSGNHLFLLKNCGSCCVICWFFLFVSFSFSSKVFLLYSMQYVISLTWRNVLEERKKFLGDNGRGKGDWKKEKRNVMYLCSIMPRDIFANYREEVNHMNCCIKRLRHAANRLIPGILVSCDLWIWVAAERAVQNGTSPLVITAELTHYPH